MLLLSKCAVGHLLPGGFEDELSGELLEEPGPDSDGLLGLGEVGEDELAPGVAEDDEDELSGLELGLPGVDEPEEAVPGLVGLVEAPDEEEEAGGVLLPAVLDSLLHPTSAAATAAAKQSFARLPKVWSMFETPEKGKGLKCSRGRSNAHARAASRGGRHAVSDPR